MKEVVKESRLGLHVDPLLPFELCINGYKDGVLKWANWLFNKKKMNAYKRECFMRWGRDMDREYETAIKLLPQIWTEIIYKDVS